MAMESSTTWMREYSCSRPSGNAGAHTRILSTVAYKQAALNCIAYLMKVNRLLYTCIPDKTPNAACLIQLGYTREQACESSNTLMSSTLLPSDTAMLITAGYVAQTYSSQPHQSSRTSVRSSTRPTHASRWPCRSAYSSMCVTAILSARLTPPLTCTHP